MFLINLCLTLLSTALLNFDNIYWKFNLARFNLFWLFVLFAYFNYTLFYWDNITILALVTISKCQILTEQCELNEIHILITLGKVFDGSSKA